MPHDDSDLDALLWGAREIGRAACVFKKDEHGKVVKDAHGEPEVDLPKIFHLIKIGVVPARHIRGRGKSRGHLVSSKRQINIALLIGETSAA
jgi:hypothetical protein